MKIQSFYQRHRAASWSVAMIGLTFCATAVTTSVRAAGQQGGQPTRNAPAPAAGQQSTPDPEHGGALRPPTGGGGGGGFGIVAYPDRPPAPQEVLDRGKALFSVNCSFCHGSDAGGGSVGPNLHRSEVVLQDKNGELILPIVQGALVSRGMPKIDLTPAQVSDIAAWLHSIKISSRGGHEEKINIVVGNANAGKAAFDRLCSSCHSTTGDLQGFAAKYTDPRAMQQAWIMPGMVGGRGGGGRAAAAAPELGIKPVTATVTEANGTQVTGKLDAVDDFYVAVTSDDGQTHRFTRINGVPKVEIHDPLAAHREMLRKYDDKDIHDITAYLESLK
jgi:cytochrome c oxidase cbb3-type subunit 3